MATRIQSDPYRTAVSLLPSLGRRDQPCVLAFVSSYQDGVDYRASYGRGQRVSVQWPRRDRGLYAVSVYSHGGISSDLQSAVLAEILACVESSEFMRAAFPDMRPGEFCGMRPTGLDQDPEISGRYLVRWRRATPQELAGPVAAAEAYRSAPRAG